MKPPWPAMGLNAPDVRPDFDWSQHPNTVALTDELDTLRTALLLASREATEARSERDTMAERVRTLEGDLAAAAGELLVPAPTPGTDMGRLVAANVLLRHEQDEAHEREEDWQRCVRVEQLLKQQAERERDAARAQLRACVSALEDEADMLEQWLRHSTPSAEAVLRRAQVLRRLAAAAPRALP